PHTPIAQGWLRASHRKLDRALTTPWRPYHTHDETQPLTPGRVYELDIEIWPTSIVLPARARLGLTARRRDYEPPGGASPRPGTLTMISEQSTQKVRNLRRDARVSVVAEAGGGGEEIRGVTVLGRAEFLPDGPERRALAEGFHAKYPSLARLWGGRAMPLDRVM